MSCSSAIATQVNKEQNLQGKACEGGLVVQWLTWVIYLAHRLCKDNQISLVQIAQKAFGALSQKYVLHLKLVLAQQVSFLELELNSCVCFEHWLLLLWSHFRKSVPALPKIELVWFWDILGFPYFISFLSVYSLKSEASSTFPI